MLSPAPSDDTPLGSSPGSRAVLAGEDAAKSVVGPEGCITGTGSNDVLQIWYEWSRLIVCRRRALPLGAAAISAFASPAHRSGGGWRRASTLIVRSLPVGCAAFAGSPRAPSRLMPGLSCCANALCLQLCWISPGLLCTGKCGTLTHIAKPSTAARRTRSRLTTGRRPMAWPAERCWNLKATPLATRRPDPQRPECQNASADAGLYANRLAGGAARMSTQVEFARTARPASLRCANQRWSCSQRCISPDGG